ncbi:MAG: DAK2 domain-containing protein [Bacteroidales bacterium]|nr:DAK2 domain-containing protein [Bacteroidales bacterium]MBR1783670.1 DAK2 domain-containing protein [Bacteroidales bacterium]
MNLNARLYLNLIRGGAARLAENRQEINDLNVFPIPDGDTGDNMYMTIEAGTHASGESLGEMAAAVSGGMLLGARGNSGVILSRIFAGMGKAFTGLDEADVQAFGKAMEAAVKEAYGAVSQPVEGTILTVLREGVAAAEGSSSLEEYMDLMIAGMDLSLQHTPELLDVLKKAGVVDSGGAGLLSIAEGMRDALKGRFPVEAGNDGNGLPGNEAPVMPGPVRASIDFNAFTEDSELEFGYCTEFLLRLQRSKVDLEHFDESVISAWLATQGDSLVFFRDGSIVKVHVHTKDPGAVLSKCRQWGEYLTVKVENMTLQHHENHMDQRFKRNAKALGIVTVAAGEGLEATFREMGADAVIRGGQTMNPSVESFLEAFKAVQAQTILVFPNNSNILLTARQAAGLYKDARVEVVPTKTLGEGYYAMANLQPDLPLEELLPSLEEAAASVTTGSVSKAIRTTAEAREGDYIGFSGKDILCSSPSREETLKALAAKLDAASADIAILLQGEGVPPEEAHSLQETLQKASPLSEVILIDGKQPVYDYILVLC